jgi:hypothetical protein
VEVLNEGGLLMVHTHTHTLLLFFSIFLSINSFCFGLGLRKERTLLDSVLSKDVMIMPCKGILKACAMSLPVS